MFTPAGSNVSVSNFTSYKVQFSGSSAALETEDKKKSSSSSSSTGDKKEWEKVEEVEER